MKKFLVKFLIILLMLVFSFSDVLGRAYCPSCSTLTPGSQRWQECCSQPDLRRAVEIKLPEIKPPQIDPLAPFRFIADQITTAFDKVGNFVVTAIINFIAWLIEQIFYLFFKLFWWINNYILAPVVDYLLTLNPFGTQGTPSPIGIIWNIFKNFAYIILVFSALAAGFKLLFGEDASATQLIFNIILVAFIVNFSFALVRTGYDIVDALERGISGGASKQLGSIIAASLWQGSDPFDEVKQIARVSRIDNQTPINEAVINAISRTFAFFFLIVFQILILIVLVMLAAIVIARYIFVLFYAGISSFAIATIAIPESKGVLASFVDSLRQFDKWFKGLITWLLVVPIFSIMVILGNIVQKTTWEQLRIYGISNLVEFVMILLFLVAWYIISMRITIKFVGKVAGVAQALAIAGLALTGGLAVGGLLNIAGGKVGGFLESTGKKIQERVGFGGPLGWRTWVSQKIGRPTEEVGKRWVQRKYGDEARAMSARLRSIEEQLTKERDEQRISKLNAELKDIIRRAQTNPYLLEQLSDSLGKMRANAFDKVARDPEMVSYLTSDKVPIEVRDKFIEQIGRMRKSTLRGIFSNKELLEAYQKATPDIVNELSERFRKELSDEDAIEALAKDDVRGILIQDFQKDGPLGKAANFLTKGLVKAIVESSAERASEAISQLSRDALLKTTEINNLLNVGGLGNQAQQIFSDAFIKADEEGRRRLIKVSELKSADDPINRIWRDLSDDDFRRLLSVLPPHLQAEFEAVRRRLRPQQSQSQAQAGPGETGEEIYTQHGGGD